ncbi:MAG: S26 family signal peptidase [Methanoregula sp.]|jgi:signal peptidase
MADNNTGGSIRTLVNRFRTSEHWAVSLARDILWMVAVVGGIALALYLLCGTWPAVVTIESGSMEPHMNIGDLVVVVAPDRFGPLQTWEDGKISGYKKFGDYGDVIIYRPNGITDFWASIGVLPLSNQHPIIHRAMIWVDAGEPQPSFLNMYRGAMTPTDYVPLRTSNITVEGYRVLYTGSTIPSGNLTTTPKDLVLRTASESYILPSVYMSNDTGYIRMTDTIAPHGGYISKGDNNPASDQGYLSVANAGEITPSQKDWVIGKALFTIPLVGLLPLHIWEVIIVLVVVMLLYEWYTRSKTEQNGKKSGKSSKMSPQKKKGRGK